MSKNVKLKESLNVIKEELPNVYDIISRYFVLYSEKESDFLQITKLVRIFSIFKKGKELQGRNLQVLTFYLKEGYSLDVKKKMARQLNIGENNVNQVNSNLRKEGYLVVDKNNTIKNYVDPELVSLVNFVINKEGKNLVISFT